MDKTFAVGDRVEVLKASNHSRVLGVGTITEVREVSGVRLYVIGGWPCARTADVLRLAPPRAQEFPS